MLYYYTSWILIRIYSHSIGYALSCDFIFHGMTTKSSKEFIMYHVILHWPVDIDRLKKWKWRPINPVSIEIWNSIQLLHFIEYIQQYFSYVVGASYIGGGNRKIRKNHPPVARGWYNNNQCVAFMITFLLSIEYVYLKTEECPDATLREQ